MNVRFYNFAKRENSTAAPSTSGGTLVQCQLLDNTSFQNPRLRLRRDPAIFGYNYFYIPDYDRFYFRSDIESDHTDLIISGTVDPMASFRGAILASTQYVIRSASKYDGWIIDDYYPATTNVHKEEVIIPAFFSGNGSYILKTMGPTGLCIYQTTLSDISSVMQFLISQCNIGDISSMSSLDDVALAFWKSSFNPFQYILECYYIPYNHIFSGDGGATIHLGTWDTQIAARQIYPQAAPYDAVDTSAILPRHPWTTSWGTAGGDEGHWLNMSPYTQYRIESPLFGTIPLPADVLSDQTGLAGAIRYAVDADYTGAVILRVSDNNGNIIAQRSANTKINIPLASSTQNIGGLLSGASSVVSGIASAVGGNPLGGLLNVTSGVGNAVNSMQNKLAVTGQSNGSTFWAMPSKLIAEFHFPATEDNNNNGRPLCKPVTLSQLSGFTVCKNADVSMTGTPGERAKIIQYMDGGFYVE